MATDVIVAAPLEGNALVTCSDAAVGFPDLPAAAARGLAEASRVGRADRAVVHVHDFAGVRPRSPGAVEVVLVGSHETSDAIKTTVVRLSADADVRGVREFADARSERTTPFDVAAFVAVQSLPDLADERLWQREFVDFVVIFSTPPPPSPARVGGGILVDGRTERLLYAASAGLGGRYLGP